MIKSAQREWWRDAVVYQIYVRSFADSNGDGRGDIEGIHSRIPYLSSLSVDAIWLTPFYPSPQADHGYDVADFMNVDPTYGTLDGFDAMLKTAHDHGIKVIIDIVPNHSSDEHEWFQAALRAAPGSPERDRYIFRDGQGPDGSLPPNNWESVFGGSAWQRIVEANGEWGQWYLHLFAVGQPDFNWSNEEVREHFRQVLRFWLDRGVDGFRIDVAHGLIKAEGLPDEVKHQHGLFDEERTPYWDQPEVHDVYRDWHKIVAEYSGDRVTVAEAWVPTAERTAAYIRPDELSMAFNFDFLQCTWNPKVIKKVVDTVIEETGKIDAAKTWVLNNHDVVRSVDRLDLDLVGGRGGTTEIRFGDGGKLNIERGRRRAVSMALLMLALPGGAYIYQGEELALPEVRDLPESALQDPTWFQTDHKDRGRDGCRVPIPWSSNPAGAFGFASDTSLTPERTWLPQSLWMGEYAVDTQQGVAGSPLETYRAALSIRKAELGDGDLEWLDWGSDVLAFSRGNGFVCVVNFGSTPIAIPVQHSVLVSNGDVNNGVVAANAAAWIRVA